MFFCVAVLNTLKSTWRCPVNHAWRPVLARCCIFNGPWRVCVVLVAEHVFAVLCAFPV